MIDISTALLALRPGEPFSVYDDKYTGITWHSKGTECPSESEINSKIKELQAAEPMRLLRVERNLRLDKTDWWASSDLVMSDDRKAYRQTLRDLPAGLDTADKVKAVTWPEKPE